VNEFGVSICLLNHSVPLEESENKRFVSRGMFPLKGVGCHTVTEVIEEIRSVELADFNSFHLLIVEPEKGVCLLTWDGAILEEEHLDTGEVPLTTSSYKSDQVVSFRRGLFAKMTADVDDGMSMALKDFHHYHDSDSSAFSVMMNRSDACTLSISHIKVDTGKVEFLYEELAWNEGDESSSIQVVLPRSGHK
jgi:hypothetical protein